MFGIEIKWVIQACVSAILIVFINVISNKYPLMASLTVAIPIISVSVMILMHIDGKDVNTIATWTTDVFWLVLPSLSFFLLFPYLVKHQFQFYSAFSISLATMIALYLGMMKVMQMFQANA